MGLDMYVRTIPNSLVGDIEVDLSENLIIPDKSFTDLAYWRKFNALHAWMKNLYLEKGGESEEFNCNTVRLLEADLDFLEEEAINKTLAPASGFFFGDQEEFSDGDKEEVLKFVEQARQALEADLAVVYHSWW